MAPAYEEFEQKDNKPTQALCVKQNQELLRETGKKLKSYGSSKTLPFKNVISFFLLKLQFLRKTTTKRPKRLETKKSFATICFCQNFAAAANGSFLWNV